MSFNQVCIPKNIIVYNPHCSLISLISWYFGMFKCLWNITCTIKIPLCVYFNPVHLKQCIQERYVRWLLHMLFFLHCLANWNTIGYVLCSHTCTHTHTSLLSLDLKITCHPPPLHNSISVSIKVGSESLKTEKRRTIRCLPWKPFHCQLGARVCLCVCVCVRNRGRERESPQALWVTDSVTFCSQASQPCRKRPIQVKHPLSTVYFFHLTDIRGPSYGNIVWSTVVFKSQSKTPKIPEAAGNINITGFWLWWEQSMHHVVHMLICAISNKMLVSISVQAGWDSWDIKIYSCSVTMKNTAPSQSPPKRSAHSTTRPFWSSPEGFYGPQMKFWGW